MRRATRWRKGPNCCGSRRSKRAQGRDGFADEQRRTTWRAAKAYYPFLFFIVWRERQYHAIQSDALCAGCLQRLLLQSKLRTSAHHPDSRRGHRRGCEQHYRAAQGRRHREDSRQARRPGGQRREERCLGRHQAGIVCRDRQQNSAGKLVALEVLVFPEAGRGTSEGHFEWDLAPGSTMTNANVDTVVEAVEGRKLKLSYKGGTRKLPFRRTRPWSHRPRPRALTWFPARRSSCSRPEILPTWRRGGSMSRKMGSRRRCEARH